MKFKKTMRKRLPRKIKKWLFKYYTRSAYFTANSCIRFYNTPNAEVTSIVEELKTLAYNHLNNMTKEEEIKYMIGDTDVSGSLIESVDRCGNCDAFCECSLGALPANSDDKACKYYSHE